LIDGQNPGWRGSRFSSLERAERALAQAVGAPGRWSLRDRQAVRK